MSKLSVLFFALHPDAVMPVFASNMAAGADLHAVFDFGKEMAVVRAGETMMIRTGVSIALSAGYEGQVRSRSGLAARNGIMVLNSPGTVDADYRGEIKIILHNTSDRDFEVHSGDRIAQLVIQQVPMVEFVNVTDSMTVQEWEDMTLRGARGFGSTGVSKVA